MLIISMIMQSNSFEFIVENVELKKQPTNYLMEFEWIWFNKTLDPISLRINDVIRVLEISTRSPFVYFWIFRINMKMQHRSLSNVRLPVTKRRLGPTKQTFVSLYNANAFPRKEFKC